MGEISEKDVLELLENRVITLRSELKRAEDALIALRGQNGYIANFFDRPVSSAKRTSRKYELPSKYDVNDKWDKKILFTLSKLQTAFREEVVKEIHAMEPELNHNNLTNLISVKLSALLKEDVLIASRVGKKYQYRLLSSFND